MEKIITPKGVGKTETLIRRSASSKNTIVCMDRAEAIRIEVEARKMKLSIPEPITFSDFVNQHNEARGKAIGFLIDNADMFLQSLSRVPVNAITMTQTDATRDYRFPAETAHYQLPKLPKF